MFCANKYIYFAAFFFLCAGAPFVTHASFNLADGLVAHWELDEGSGTSIRDATGNGSDGEVVGPVVWTEGHFGGAFNFTGDGIISYVGFASPSNKIPIGNSPYTLSAWMKSDGAGGVQGIIGWGNYGNDNQVTAFRLDSGVCSGFNGLDIYWWGDDLVSCADPINIYDGNWHNVLTTYDGSTKKLYVDGGLIGQMTPLNAVHDVPDTSHFAIGLTATAFNEYFNGSLDDVRVYDRALSPEEITALYGALSADYTGVVTRSHTSHHTTSSRTSVPERIQILIRNGNLALALQLMHDWPNQITKDSLVQIRDALLQEYLALFSTIITI